MSHLRFPDDTVDLVTAIETQSYWPDLEGDMREILRVLKPAGKIIIIGEMYKGGKYDWLKMASDVVVALLAPQRERSSGTVRIDWLCKY